ALLDLGEASPPGLLGCALALPPLAPFLTRDVGVPGTGFSLTAAHLRDGAVLLAAGWCGALALCLLAAVLLNAVERRPGTVRPRPLAGRLPWWRPALFPVAVATVVSASRLHGNSGFLLYLAGTILLWASLPSVAGLAARHLGRLMVRWGSGRPAMLIGGRWAAAHPGVCVRMGAALIVGLGLVCQLQVWSDRFEERAAPETRAGERTFGDTVLRVGVRDGDVTAFAGSLPRGSTAIALRTTERQQGDDLRVSVVFAAPCPALRAARLPCPAGRVPTTDPRLRQAVWPARASTFLETAPIDGARELVVLGPRGQRQAVTAAAWRSFRHPTVDVPWQSAIGNGYEVARMGPWIFLGGLCGIGLLLLSALISVAAEFLRFGAALAPLTVLTDRPSLFRGVAFWHLAVPIFLSALFGTVLAAWHGLYFIATVQESHLDWVLLLSVSSATCLTALLIALLAGRSALRAARSWRPVAD
ncbi:hypothetical protein, partial [Actinocorallia lasiicapitis]